MDIKDDVMDKQLDRRLIPPAVRHRVRMIHKRNLRAALTSSLLPLRIQQTPRRDDPANMARRVAADERRQRQARRRRRDYARCIGGNWMKTRGQIGRNVVVTREFVRQYS